MIDVSKFISGCKYMGGNNQKDGEKLVCVLENDVGIMFNPNLGELEIMDKRSDGNVTELQNVDMLRIVEGINPAFIIGAGASSVLFSREKGGLKVVTTIMDEPMYPMGQTPQPQTALQRAGCPVGSMPDTQGSCVPQPEQKGMVPPSPVPHPTYLDKKWSEYNEDALILIDEDTRTMLKATLGTWLNSKSNPAAVFRKCSESLAGIEIKIGDELKGRDPEKEGPNYDVQIGRSVFDRRRLYEVAEELEGRPILDKKRQLPLGSLVESGDKIIFDAFKSPDPDMPIAVTVRDTGDVYYLIAPKLEVK